MVDDTLEGTCEPTLESDSEINAAAISVSLVEIGEVFGHEMSWPVFSVTIRRVVFLVEDDNDLNFFDGMIHPYWESKCPSF